MERSLTDTKVEGRARLPSLVLGSDIERWAPHAKQSMVSPASWGLRSASASPAQTQPLPLAAMRASTSGIAWESMQRPSGVPTQPGRIVSPGVASPGSGGVSPTALSPGALSPTAITSPPRAKSPPGVLSPASGMPSRIGRNEMSSVGYLRAQRRLLLEQSTRGVNRAGIPLYGDRHVLALVPRRKVEHVEGTLYDPDGPFREGAVSDSLSVRVFYAPASDKSYLITTPDNRVSSAAKRRRWAMDQQGIFYAAMEIKSIEDKLRHVYDTEPYPLQAREIAGDLAAHFIDDVLDELQKAETLVPSVTPLHVLSTEDGRLVRLEEDFPEEVFFLLAGCDENELAAVIHYVFVETIEELWRIHSHGWMHGDIKLENLMIRRNGRIVLIDFENAAPFRGSGAHDGQIQLLSFDWTPPELEQSLRGRRIGPSGDLWALGCNLVRAFALRDGVEDAAVRDMLLGAGRDEFFAFRASLKSTLAAYGIDLSNIRANDSPYARLLRRFAADAPRLLQYLLAHAITPTPAERDEAAGVAFAQALRADPAHAGMWATVHAALESSIEHSGSTWVCPKLDVAREILEID